MQESHFVFIYSIVLIAAFEPYRCGVLISVASLSDAERVCRARLSSNVKLKFSMRIISCFQRTSPDACIETSVSLHFPRTRVNFAFDGAK